MTSLRTFCRSVIPLVAFASCVNSVGDEEPGSGAAAQPDTACTVQGAIRDKYLSLGGPASFLGSCVTNELPTPDGAGRYNHFVGGSIYWTPTTGAHEVHGAIRDRWSSLGWEQSPLHYPTTDEMDMPGGRQSGFQGGVIRWQRSSGATQVVADGDEACAIPANADPRIHVAASLPGVRCTRYPFELAAPRGVMESANGSIFVTEYSGGRVSELGPNGFNAIVSGLAGPIGLAQAQDGSVYVSEESPHSLSRIDVGTGQRTPIATDLDNATYLAIGPDQAAYVSSFKAFDATGAVKRVPLDAFPPPPSTDSATALNVPEGLFFESDEAMVVAEWNPWNQATARVLRFPPGVSDARQATTVADGFQHVYGIASNGTAIYVADTGNRVVRVLPDGTVENVLVNIAQPAGLAFTSGGDLLVAEFVDFGARGYLLRLTGL